MDYNTNNIEGKLLAEQKFKQLIDKGATISILEKKETRSDLQRRSKWLYLTMVCNELNEQGQTHHITDKLEARYTKELLDEVYFKSLKETMFGKKRLNTKEYAEVCDMLLMLFAKLFDIDIPFPNIEDVAK